MIKEIKTNHMKSTLIIHNYIFGIKKNSKRKIKIFQSVLENGHAVN